MKILNMIQQLTSKIDGFLNFISNAFALVVFVVIISWYCDNTLPVESVDVISYTKQVQQGGTFKAVLHVKKKRNDCKIFITRYVIDSKGLAYTMEAPSEEYTSKLEYTKVITFKIPMDISVGEAKYFASVLYSCNPIKNMHYDAKDIPFQITPFEIVSYKEEMDV